MNLRPLLFGEGGGRGPPCDVLAVIGAADGHGRVRHRAGVLAQSEVGGREQKIRIYGDAARTGGPDERVPGAAGVIQSDDTAIG